jgi:hypothetical protein
MWMLAETRGVAFDPSPVDGGCFVFISDLARCLWLESVLTRAPIRKTGVRASENEARAEEILGESQQLMSRCCGTIMSTKGNTLFRRKSTSSKVIVNIIDPRKKGWPS